MTHRGFPHSIRCLLAVLMLALGCARTEIVDSPRTAFVPEGGEVKEPNLIWTSRPLIDDFDYLGLVKVRSWTYEGALSRLKDGARELRADAVIDIHYERVGFMKTMQAFAIKFR